MVVIIVFQFGLTKPMKCNNDYASRNYLATVCLIFVAYSASFFTELAMMVVGLRVYGTWVIADVHLRRPDVACWFKFKRDTGVHYLVYFMWAHQAYNWARVLIIYNIFPTFDSIKSWRRRLIAVAVFTRSHHAVNSVEKRMGTWNMRQITEMYAGIIRGVDLAPTDEIDALLLLKGLQQMRRLTHVADTFKNALGIPAGIGLLFGICFFDIYPFSLSFSKCSRAEDRLPADLQGIPQLTRIFNEVQKPPKESSSDASKETVGQQSPEYLEEGRAADSDTRLHATLDSFHCLTPTGYASAIAPELDPAEAAELYTGHHESVSGKELHEASNFLRFAIAAYHTQAYTWQVGRKQEEPPGALPYIVALDRRSRSVVVAVRGTWSMADCVTDIIALPKSADQWLPPSLQQKQKDGELDGVYAHSGVLSAASLIWKDMEEHGILPVLLSRNEKVDRPSGEDVERLGEDGQAQGKYAAHIARLGLQRDEWSLVLVGHSLGAGVAALLALKMLNMYPDVRCWAYSPPGGLVCPNLSAILGDFCCGIAVGKDAVPRLSLKNLDRLLDDMIVALARSNMHTLRLLGVAVAGKKQRRRWLKNFFRPPDKVPEEALQFLSEFRKQSAQVDKHSLMEMLPPGRMVFLRRLKRLEKSKRRSEDREVTWDAVYISPEEILREGLLVSGKMLADHQLTHLNEALKSAEGVDPDGYTREIQAANLPAQKSCVKWMAGARGPKGGQRPRHTGLLDRVLVQRVENYAQTGELGDIEAVSDHLRATHKEYQRRQRSVFIKQVERALGVARQRNDTLDNEAQLQELEHRHFHRRQHSRDPDEPSPSTSTSYGSGDSDSSSGADMDVKDGADLDRDIEQSSLAALSGSRSRMNAALTSIYASGQPPGGASPTASHTSMQPGRPQPETQQQAQSASTVPVAVLASGPEQKTTSSPNVLPGVSGAQSGRQVAIAQPPVLSPLPGRAPEGGAAASKEPADQGKKRRRGGKEGDSTQTGNAWAAAKRKRMASASSSAISQPRPVRYTDLGGIEAVLSDIKELVEYPLQHPEVYAWLGVEPPRGVLLHGPPGCGKTALANAIANECGVPFLRISAPEIVAGVSGESEAKVRQLFQEATALAPCIIFIDEIDAIAAKRETAQREMERRIVAQMLTCMDDLSEPPLMEGADSTGGTERGDPTRLPKHVVVIGATNRPDSLDAALRRAGRFDREIALGIPSQEARAKILQVLARRLRLEGDFDFAQVAARTPGFVGADLTALVKEAAAIAVTRIFSELQAVEEAAAQPMALLQPREALTVPKELAQEARAAVASSGAQPLSMQQLAGLAIRAADFDAAVKKVQPSVRREGFATTPDVTWNDVGSLAEVREELAFSITEPIKHPERFTALGLAAPTGVLLYGPPGCGKTLVAKAVANESGANFMSIKGPELLNKYVGESERAVRQLFARARAASPCVLFFDELDALAPRRGSDVSQSSERVVNQLLTEMDGIDGRTGVYLVAATNRPDIIDSALLRPGRLDKLLYVPLPPPDGRVAILQALTRATPLATDVNLSSIGLSPRINGYSGADLAALVREAAVTSLKEAMQEEVRVGAAPGSTPQVHMRHFQAAMSRIQPSVSWKDQRVYDALRQELRRSRLALQPAAGEHQEVPSNIDGSDPAAIDAS
ncbi:probable nuclear valosin-containing protein-like at C-terminar half [Coccomyxa sp. Obi]|nr:probable nuclear valosin-containing protein-like at C-terminar half [Coccomyxa sp. Obi]